MLPELEVAARHWQQVTDYLVALARAVEPSCWGEPSPYPDWSNKDLLAHLAAGYAVRRSYLEHLVARNDLGPRIDIDAANAERTAERRDTPVEALIEEMVATRGRLLELMGQLRRENLDVELQRSGPPPYMQRFGDFLLDFSSHDLEHAEELRGLAREKVRLPNHS